MSGAIIARFDKENPCWTSDLLESAGEDIESLPELISNGTLEVIDGIYSLTKTGIEEFGNIKEELFLDGEPGVRPADAARSAARTELRILLDKAHSQRWGIKDYRLNVSLPIHPDLSGSDIFSLEEDRLKWNYTESPVWIKMERDFPQALIDNRRVDIVPPEKLDKWLTENSPEAGALRVDLLYLCRYDFMQYRDFTGHPNDPMRLINTDRFLFVFPAPDINENIETIGKFHLWLGGLRRMRIPGYTDRDTQEQDSVTWLVFTTVKEEDAVALASQLGGFGEELVRNANPCEIWTLSMEALKGVDKKRELVWELLPDIAHHAQRTLI